MNWKRERHEYTKLLEMEVKNSLLGLPASTNLTPHEAVANGNRCWLTIQVSGEATRTLSEAHASK